MLDRRLSCESSSFSSDMKTKSSPVESPCSPNISRYGRSHKPKMQDDFVSTDKKVSAYLKLSPGNQIQFYSAQKEQKKKGSPKKLDVKPEGTPKRGRPPKSPPKDNSDGELKVSMKAEPQDPSLPVDGCEWMVGDLAWARVGGHPFWPCIIALDPLQKIFTKTIRKGRTTVSQRWVHVQFFGDNGRRSWLNSTAVMSYNGRDAFIQLGDTILAGMRKKEPKQTSAFVIKPAVIQVWEKAVQEAEDLIHSTREERTDFFATHFPTAPQLFPLTREKVLERLEESNIETSPPKKQARKRKMEQSPAEDEIKKMKLENVEVKVEPVDPLLTTTPRTIADRKKRQALLMQLARSSQSPVTSPHLPPASPSTPKQTPLKRPGTSELTVSAENKKPKKKYVKKKVEVDFQTFSSKHFDRVSDDHPELNEKEIYKYLQKMWNEMDESQKARYRSRFTGQEKEEAALAEETSDDVDGSTEDIEEEVRSSKSSSPAPLAVATQKTTSTKRNNWKYLFSGAKAEKVCQICERAGDTVRCRGPCQGYYHPDCLTTPPTPPPSSPTIARKVKRGRPKKSLGQSPAPGDSSCFDQPVENGMTPTKEHDSKLSEVVELKVKMESCDKSVDSVVVEVVEAEGKNASKVRKSSKDSDSGEESEGFRCKDCQEGRSQPCFVCQQYILKKTGEAKLYRCITAYCGKVYHEECLKPWPQSSWRSNGNGKSNERGVMTCPQHTCHTCASDNPGVIKARYSNDKLVRCIRCPTTYHYGNYCLPAGSDILNNSQVICPRHYQPQRKALIHHVNAAWCFICASGGSLICCDLCPTAFHADCLNISTPPDGSYVCEDCLTGRFPLYGEIVWVKLGTYRWWPAEILYPALIPDNILNLPHVQGEFAVRFFGSHDHYWVNRGRVFLYQDGDTAGKGNYKKSSVDHAFERAVREASEAQSKYLEEKATRDAETRPGMKPPNYVKLKANKPVGNVRTMEMNVSSLTPCECDPQSTAPCAPESDCLNRILMVECNPLVCPAGDKCCNQLFEKRQYPPLQPYHTQARGWGLKTLVALKKGDFVIEYVGEMIDEEEYKKRLSHMHKNNEENFYFLTIDKDRMLDAGPKGNVARFMNHSCQPNCETQKWTVNGDTRVGLFALCDISANTELVFNYNLESIGTDKKPCMCGAPNCSGFIGVKVTKATDKEESKEKKPAKKKKVVAVSKAHEEECFVCGECGELLLCDGKHCTKGYHLSCLGKKQRPQGYWLCPWHQCNVCNKGRVRRCTFCVNSYCQEHSEGNIRLDSDRGLVCSKHDQEEVTDNKEDIPKAEDSSTKVGTQKSDPAGTEYDEDSNTNSATDLKHSGDLESTVVPVNNNIIKTGKIPEQRTRRSKSFTADKPTTDMAVNGVILKVSRRRGRPSSVDEKLIVSYKKTEPNNKPTCKQAKPDSEDNSCIVVKELLDEVLNTLPVKETDILENINEGKDTAVNILELEGNVNTVSDFTKCENEEELGNQSFDKVRSNTERVSSNHKIVKLETHNPEESFDKNDVNIDKDKNTNETESINSGEVLGISLSEAKVVNLDQDCSTKEEVDGSVDKVNIVSDCINAKELTKVSENMCNEKLEKPENPDEGSVNYYTDEKENEDKSVVLTKMDVDDHIDDFELSYSECSNDNIYKNVNNSKSSIEMKVADCLSTSSEKITKQIPIEINGQTEFSNCVEQPNAMEVA